MISMKVGDERVLTRDDAGRVIRWLTELEQTTKLPLLVTEENFIGAVFLYLGEGRGKLTTTRPAGNVEAGATVKGVPCQLLCAEFEVFAELV